MRTIWKYALVPGEQLLDVPRPARLLTATAQADGVALYALVDPSTTQQQRLHLRVLGTGHHTTDDLDRYGYVATVFMPTAGGLLVWHVFARWAEHAELAAGKE